MEASVVISVSFFVLAALMFVMFLLHDRCVAQSASCEAAAAASNFSKTEEQRSAAEAVTKQVSGERFMGSGNAGGHVSVGEKEAVAVWEGTCSVPGFAAKYLSGNDFSIRGSWSSKLMAPAETIRKIKGIGTTLIGGDD